MMVRKDEDRVKATTLDGLEAVGPEGRKMRAASFLMVVTCFFAILPATSSGCATVLHGSTQKIWIESDPPGAVVTVGKHRVKTPASVRLKRAYRYVVTIRKDGYEPQYVFIKNREMSSKAYFNWFLVVFVWAGFLVDGLTASLWELNPSVISVKLVPSSTHHRELPRAPGSRRAASPPRPTPPPTPAPPPRSAPRPGSAPPSLPLNPALSPGSRQKLPASPEGSSPSRSSKGAQ